LPIFFLVSVSTSPSMTTSADDASYVTNFYRQGDVPGLGIQRNWQLSRSVRPAT
jgi:hypothetical protein